MSSSNELRQQWRVAEKKLAISKGTPVHSITSLFNNTTGFEWQVLVDWDGFFKNWTEVVEDTDFPDGLLMGVGAHVIICGHMGQHDLLKWYFTLEEPKYGIFTSWCTFLTTGTGLAQHLCREQWLCM
jgi:hypothetical protein